MAKKKRFHFEECTRFPHFFQPRYHDLQKGFRYRGNWYPDFFCNASPLTLELGCGKAEYSVYLATRYPQRNSLAIDIKGARMWKGARQSLDAGLNNIAFVRTHSQNLTDICAAGEVEEIWIPFPEPHPNKPAERKRLTSPRLLDTYAKVLRPGHTIHLKTDNPAFFEYTREVIDKYNHQILYSTCDLYASGFSGDVREVVTFYEEQWLKEGASIHYLQFRLNGF